MLFLVICCQYCDVMKKHGPIERSLLRWCVNRDEIRWQSESAAREVWGKCSLDVSLQCGCAPVVTFSNSNSTTKQACTANGCTSCTKIFPMFFFPKKKFWQQFGLMSVENFWKWSGNSEGIHSKKNPEKKIEKINKIRKKEWKLIVKNSGSAMYPILYLNLFFNNTKNHWKKN